MSIIRVRPKRDHPNGRLCCDYCYEGVNELNRRGTLGMICNKCDKQVDDDMVQVVCNVVSPLLPVKEKSRPWWHIFGKVKG